MQQLCPLISASQYRHFVFLLIKWDNTSTFCAQTGHLCWQKKCKGKVVPDKPRRCQAVYSLDSESSFGFVTNQPKQKPCDVLSPRRFPQRCMQHRQMNRLALVTILTGQVTGWIDNTYTTMTTRVSMVQKALGFCCVKDAQDHAVLQK